MGSKYLIDTNILIYFLNGDMPRDEEVKVAMLSSNFSLSSITIAELLSWKELSDNDAEQILKGLESVKIIPADVKICAEASKIRRNWNTKLGDAIIAATSLTEGLILVTNDLSDFKQIADLATFHPY
jgi:predicted nucleic acid-binding protein